MKSRYMALSLTASALLFFVGGCVSSSETKLASTQYKTALAAYTQNVKAFEAAWLAEVDLLLRDLGDALTAHAVAQRIQTLSARYDGFSNRDWEREVANNGLITLSEAISNERERVRGVLSRLSGIELQDSEIPATAIVRFLGKYRDETIDAIPDAGGILSVEERERLLAEAEAGPFGDDDVANSIVEMILTWELARDAIPDDLRDLKTVLAALKTAHKSVDRWIQTDVTVPGEDVAALVQAWSATMGGSQ